jgi:hypothetical protein
VILKLALRSLAVRPIRTAVLACGFGLGIAVMAELLGVGDVILDQARSPALQGGGDLVMSGAFGTIDNAPYVLSVVRGATGNSSSQVVAASPSRRANLYLIKPGLVVPILARGGIPSLEKAVGDGEVAGIDAWTDTPADTRWTKVDPAAVLRSMDRFHRPPDVPEFSSSWAEWLYFNGRTADGRVRFYLTFMVGPSPRPGMRSASVRLQLDRDGQVRNYGTRAEVDEQAVLDGAPDLDIGGNQVRLDGLRYRISLNLRDEAGASSGNASTVRAQLTLDPDEGRSLPPAVIRGARGWLSGYVVPVLSGRMSGRLTVGSEALSIDGASGYHDHNWGFWRDVRWQWGQVADGDLSLVYGRVFPPADVADPDRMPGFLGVLDRQGLVGVATNVTIVESRDDGRTDVPEAINVTARGNGVDLRLAFAVDRSIRSGLQMTGGANDFLQMGGTYRVEGRAGGRTIDFTNRGAAETFRPR